MRLIITLLSFYGINDGHYLSIQFHRTLYLIDPLNYALLFYLTLFEFCFVFFQKESEDDFKNTRFSIIYYFQ